ncbi:MAG: hypothetical protein KDD64_16455 [Bdellovibrionales bacterium]|nr:hypothetical protein [Bdellovibrionales bacterium]
MAERGGPSQQNQALQAEQEWESALGTPRLAETVAESEHTNLEGSSLSSSVKVRRSGEEPEPNLDRMKRTPSLGPVENQNTDSRPAKRKASESRGRKLLVSQSREPETILDKLISFLSSRLELLEKFISKKFSPELDEEGLNRPIPLRKKVTQKRSTRKTSRAKALVVTTEFSDGTKEEERESFDEEDSADVQKSPSL